MSSKRLPIIPAARRLATLCALLHLAGCSTDTPVDPFDSRTFVPAIPAPGGAPSIMTLEIGPSGPLNLASEPLNLALGATITFKVELIATDGQRTPARALWRSTVPGIVALHPHTGVVNAVAPGTTTIVAVVGDRRASKSVTVVPATQGTTSTALLVSEFVMFEAPHGSYAPQMNLTAAPGRAVTVLVLTFTIPGMGSTIPFECGGAISADDSRQLNGEVYGSWTFEFFSMLGLRATGEDATAMVTFIDDTGATGTVIARGPVVAGTELGYTGGENGGPCFHGYGSPGVPWPGEPDTQRDSSR